MHRARVGSLLFFLVAGTSLECGSDDCEEDADCGDGEYCRFGGISESTCSETRLARCMDVLPAGTRCTSILDRCVEGYSCNDGLDGLRCVAPQPLGGPCGFDGQCAGSSEDDGPVCHMPSGSRGTCEQPGSVLMGERCQVDRACAPGLTCRYRQCAGPS